eukprot:scaffold136451_cov36-Tisochrysis_lutea.AAC.2
MDAPANANGRIPSESHKRRLRVAGQDVRAELKGVSAARSPGRLASSSIFSFDRRDMDGGRAIARSSWARVDFSSFSRSMTRLISCLSSSGNAGTTSGYNLFAARRLERRPDECSAAAMASHRGMGDICSRGEGRAHERADRSILRPSIFSPRN